MSVFSSVHDFIEEVTSTNSLNEKKDILQAYSEDELLQQVLLYTYDGLKQYNVTSKNVAKYSKNKKYNDQEFLKYDFTSKGAFRLLDDLSERKTTGHEALKTVNEYIKGLDEQDKNLFLLILDKNLKIRISTSVINKVIPGLIPTFEPVLSKEFDPHHNKLNENWFISIKLDGVRSLIHVDKSNNSVTAYSRNGKELFCLDKILSAVPIENIKESVFLDGETVYIDSKTGLEDFTKTIEIVRSSKKQKDSTHLYFKIFDMIPEKEFYAAEGKSKFTDRLKLLEKTFKGNKRIKIVEQIPYSEDKFTQMQEEVKEKGYEGLMLRRGDVPYKGKRIRDLAKVKSFKDEEFEVVDVINNKMRFINEKTGLEEEIECLAAIVIKNKKIDVQVGSGFSLSERKEYFNNSDKIIGKKVTIKYFQETEDGSLRFPIFKGIRNYE